MTEMTDSVKKREIVDSIARFYEKKCEEKIGADLEALYLFGSYAFGKISLFIPDINYFLLLKERVSPDVFLKHADILREVCNEFKGVATVMPEFRPNRYVYPTTKGADFDVTLCTQYARMEDRHGPVPFGWGRIPSRATRWKRLQAKEPKLRTKARSLQVEKRSPAVQIARVPTTRPLRHAHRLQWMDASVNEATWMADFHHMEETTQ
ncbi:MAG: hypothetical protein H6Q55_2519 [Deltaproteobacteria bacterium]|nr:hypothetical protein [Deltaproteobacteria bacterium]